jgi:uncharacterized protein (DUF488 family)
MVEAMPLRVYTIGHSTHPIATFLEMLKQHGAHCLADVRTIPRSRHNPQYDREELVRALAAAEIHYRHMPGLGGLRKPRRDSRNTGWRNASFRGYADYMQTREFQDALQTLMEVAAGEPTAVMCAEAVPWRCHRSLIADALLVRGCEVVEIESAVRSRPMALHAWARVDGTELSYPDNGGQQQLDLNAG